MIGEPSAPEGADSSTPKDAVPPGDGTDGLATPKDALSPDDGANTSTETGTPQEDTAPPKKSFMRVGDIKPITMRFFGGSKSSDRLTQTAEADKAAAAEVSKTIRDEAGGTDSQPDPSIGISREAHALNQPPEPTPPATGEKAPPVDPNLQRIIEGQRKLTFSLESPPPDINAESAEAILRWASVPGRDLSGVDSRIKEIAGAFLEGATKASDLPGSNLAWTADEREAFLDSLASADIINRKGKPDESSPTTPDSNPSWNSDEREAFLERIARVDVRGSETPTGDPNLQRVIEDQANPGTSQPDTTSPAPGGETSPPPPSVKPGNG